MGCGNLGAAAPAAMLPVGAFDQGGFRLHEQILRTAARLSAAAPGCRSARCTRPATSRICARSSSHDLASASSRSAKRGHVVPWHRWEVRAGIERPQIGSEEDRHGPASGSGHRGGGLHVDGVEIRALFAVDLDAHEVGVQDGCGACVLERLVCHHVAPVTGRVANAEEDGLILVPGPLQRLLAPRIPVHGIVGVLQQVRGVLSRQSIGH